MIPEKAYQKLLDLDAELCSNPSKDTIHAFETYADKYGWPWKASSIQMRHWDYIQAQRNNH
jgi:hypothetical protein